MPKFIFVTGGVISSLGKGVASASIGCLLQKSGFTVDIRKLDPYLNIDPGTMNPIQHGEVYITKDGGETDLDLGYYERIAGIECTKNNNITSGAIYQRLLGEERKGIHLGKTIQIVPHVTDIIKEYIYNNSKQFDFVIIEIGGTVGDIEIQPFLEAIRQVRYEVGYKNSLFIHLTYLPYIKHSQELKTKPTQHSFKEIMRAGIVPDFLLCRADQSLNQHDREKIARLCGIKNSNVVCADDVSDIHLVAETYFQQSFHTNILNHFDLREKTNPEHYLKIISKIIQDKRKFVVKIGIVGKYTESRDCYKSLIAALEYGAIDNNAVLEIVWINAKLMSTQYDLLKTVDCILVPGGFGVDGFEGKIQAVEYARINNIPFLGICFGMQIAVIEYARNVCNIKNATSSEIEKNENNVICLMNEWIKDDGSSEIRKENAEIGGTMRLGEYKVRIEKNTLAHGIYEADEIQERHRHRYVVNVNFINKITDAKGLFSGFGCHDNLPEIFEIPSHKFFIGVQFHPEFNTKIDNSSKIFNKFIQSGLKK